MKIAVLLFCIMGCTLLIRFLEDKSVKSINHAFVSMYNDRLIPASDLFYIAEKMADKNYLIENVLVYAEKPFYKEDVQQKLNRHNKSIDSLIAKYEQTQLINQEKKYLNDLKNSLFIHRDIENKILTISDKYGLADGKKLYESSGREMSQATLDKLADLIRIQTTVGADLIKDSEVFVSGTELYSAVQTILAIVIGILIVGIVFASNTVKIQNDKFKLN